MPAFRFRAQAALDFRKQQEEAALAVLGEARRESDAADAARAAAQRALDEALARAGVADAAGGEVTLAIWYRNWMRAQRRELARAEAVAEDRRVQLEAAERKLVDARRRVRVLERLRARMLAAHGQQERRVEQKALDELAVLQYATRQRGDGA